MIQTIPARVGLCPVLFQPPPSVPLVRLTRPKAQAQTKPPDSSDTEPRFVGVVGVKPREATADGGLGLTPAAPTQAQSAIGGDNVLGNGTSSCHDDPGSIVNGIMLVP